MVTSDVEKNLGGTRAFRDRVPPCSLPAVCSCGTRVFKTRVPQFSFGLDYSWVFFFFPCSFSSASALLHSRSLHLFFRSSAFLDLLLQFLPLLLQIFVLRFCSSKFFLRFWLPIWFINSSSLSSVDSFIELKFEKLEFHVDILLQLSTRTRVFETRICNWTRASKTQDASFQFCFHRMLTYYIDSHNYTSWKINFKKVTFIKKKKELRCKICRINMLCTCSKKCCDC